MLEFEFSKLSYESFIDLWVLDTDLKDFIIGHGLLDNVLVFLDQLILHVLNLLV